MDLRSKVTVINREGKKISLDEWQGLYGIAGDFIGKYFSLREDRFINDITAFGALYVNELLIRLLDEVRFRTDRAMTLNSFNRSKEHQKYLREKGLKAAQYSPHEVYMAADIETKNEAETRYMVKMIQQVAADLGIKVRIGFEQYLKAGSTFVHVDVCPEYYAPGKPFNKMFHPLAWEKVITW